MTIVCFFSEEKDVKKVDIYVFNTVVILLMLGWFVALRQAASEIHGGNRCVAREINFREKYENDSDHEPEGWLR